MKTTLVMAIASILALAGCSQSGPSDRVIADCIARANGFEGVGEKLENRVMGEVWRTVIMNDVVIQNVIERGENLYIAQAIVEMGVREASATDEEQEFTAEMMGFKLKDGYLMKDAQVTYQFSEGNRGWSCQEI